MLGIYKCRMVKTPSRGTSKSAGYDFYIPGDINDKILFEFNPHLKIYKKLFITENKFYIPPHERIRIPSGIHIKLPPNTMMQMNEKSGIATKSGLSVMAKIIDEDYEGEVSISVQNETNYPVYLENGQKIVQGIIIPILYEQIVTFTNKDEMYPEKSERGEGGFGSTGKF